MACAKRVPSFQMALLTGHELVVDFPKLICGQAVAMPHVLSEPTLYFPPSLPETSFRWKKGEMESINFGGQTQVQI